METNIQSIIDKIYHEGIDKAVSEAEGIVQNAKKEAAAILDQANAEKEQIISQAVKESERLKESTRSELKLAADQTLSELRRQTENLITNRVLNEGIQASALNPYFLQKLILAVCERWPEGSVPADWELQIPAALGKEAEEKLSAAILEVLPGTRIMASGNINGGFIIQKKGEHFHLEFTDEALKEFLSPFLRKMIAKLFLQG